MLSDLMSKKHGDRLAILVSQDGTMKLLRYQNCQMESDWQKRLQCLISFRNGTPLTALSSYIYTDTYEIGVPVDSRETGEES